MKQQHLLLLVGGLIVVAGLLAAVTSCGGGSDTGIVGGRGTGDLVIAVNWGNSRYIPPDAVRIDVAVSGEGLREPVTATIQRPESQTVIRNLPVGFKMVFGEAKNSQGQTVARGSGNTRIDEGQRASVDIVMAEVTPGGGTVLVHTTRDGVPASADFVAFQDGNGAWQVAQGTGGHYTLNVTDNDGRYGVAVVCVSDGRVDVRIYHATRNEVNEFTVECESPPPQNFVTVSGTVSGLGANDYANVYLGQGLGFAYPGTGIYSLQTAPGTYDLIATRYSGQTGSLDGVLIRRNVNATANTTQDIDFGSGEAFAPELHTVTVLGGTGELGGNVSFRSSGKTVASVGITFGETVRFAGIPTNRQVGNDYHVLSVSDLGAGGLRSVMRYFKAPTDFTVSLPDAFTSPQVTTAATTPYVRLTASWNVYPDAQAYNLVFQPAMVGPEGRASKRSRQQGAGVLWYVGLSKDWLGANSSYTLPDFSGLNGWNNAWGLPAGRGIDWQVFAVSSNRSLAELIASQSQLVDGLEIRQAGKSGTITP